MSNYCYNCGPANEEPGAPIVLCPLHAAVSDLLAVAKTVLEVADDFWLTDESLEYLADRGFSLQEILSKVKEAVAKAEGRLA